MRRHSIVHPETDGSTGLDTDLVDSNESTTNGRRAISAMYNVTSILAAPTPYICVSKLVLPKSGRGALTSPPIARPANITPVFPMAATCIAEPTQKTPPVIIRLIFRPTLSTRGATAKEPKKLPGWSRETMLAWNALTVASSASISQSP